MAAAAAARAGAAVTVFDHMPSPARKLLIAGRGGLNLTHTEPLGRFLDRYGAARGKLEPFIRDFPPAAVVGWCERLGQPTFAGSSGRIFPRAMKASPLLRAWLAELASFGVALRPRHRWLGFTPDGALRVATPDGEATHRAGATVLALGGASWPKLGSDGAWTALLPGTVPLKPANMGFAVAWSAALRARFAGAPLKRIAVSIDDAQLRGEAMITDRGIEGGAIYALSARLRDAIAAHGSATLRIDLRPDIARAALAARLNTPRGSLTMTAHLRRAGGLSPPAIALVQEALHAGAPRDDLAGLVKALPVTLDAPFPIERAISSAGGLGWQALDDRLMLRRHPGVFACGEMLDWEAPTGGYLLQACFATGHAAGAAAAAWAAQAPHDRPPVA
jgi:uncharacterized flavoprotein (TIGR03862 family)